MVRPLDLPCIGAPIRFGRPSLAEDWDVRRAEGIAHSGERRSAIWRADHRGGAPIIVAGRWERRFPQKRTSRSDEPSARCSATPRIVGRSDFLSKNDAAEKARNGTIRPRDASRRSSCEELRNRKLRVNNALPPSVLSHRTDPASSAFSASSFFPPARARCMPGIAMALNDLLAR
jgi:hypothetical protein